MRTDTSLVLNLIAGMFTTIASGGAVYTFSLFAPALRQQPYLYSEAEISSVAAWFVFATFLNAPAGAIFDKFGARWTLAVACTVMTLSWVLISTVVLDEKLLVASSPAAGKPDPPSKLVVTLLFALPPFAGSFVEIGAVMGLMSVFKLQQQVVVILTKTVLGLGSTIVAVIFAAWYAPELSASKSYLKEYSDFAHLLAIYSFVVIAILAFAIGHGDKRCAGLTVPPASAAKGYKPMMVRGEILLIVGIAALTLGNLLTVSASAPDAASGSDRPANPQMSQLLHNVLAVAAIIFPFTFFSLIAALPSEAPVAPEPEHHHERGCDFDELQRSRKKLFAGTRHAVEGSQRRQSALLDAEERLATPIASNPHNDGDTEDLRRNSSEKDEEPSIGDFLSGKHSPGGRVWPDPPHDIEDLHDELPACNTNSVWANIKKRELWMLWFVCFCVWGSTSMIYANSSSIYRALPGTKTSSSSSSSSTLTKAAVGADGESSSSSASDEAVPLPFRNSVNAIFVALLGTGNALGRMFAGKAVPVLQARGRSGLAELLLLPPVLAALGAAMLLVTEGTALWLGFSLIGLAVGVNWGSLILIVKRLFTANPGTHYAFMYTAGAATPFIFTMLLFKRVYAAYEVTGAAGAAEDGDGTTPNITLLLLHPGQPSCHGHKCVSISLWVCIALNFIAYKVAGRLVESIDVGVFDTSVQSIPVRDLSHQRTEVYFIPVEDEKEKKKLVAKQTRGKLLEDIAGGDQLKDDEVGPEIGKPPQWILQYSEWMVYAEKEVYPKLAQLEEQMREKLAEEEKAVAAASAAAASGGSSSSSPSSVQLQPGSATATATVIRMDNAEQQIMDMMTDIQLKGAPGSKKD